jgi:hypothetical protein
MIEARWCGAKKTMNLFRSARGAAAWAVTLLLFAITPAFAADNVAQKRYPLSGHGYFQLDVPAGWKDRVAQPSRPAPPTIEFIQDQQGRSFIATIVPAWQSETNESPLDKEALRRVVEHAARGMLQHSTESEPDINEIGGATGSGYCFSVTDKASEPGDYRFMTRGALRVGELTVLFTILANPGQEQVVRDALAMLQGAVHGKD